jgi:hypothetical protein
MNATQIGAAASFWGSTNTSVAAMTANAYYNSDGDYIYINTDEASQYIQVDGTHSWLNAPSGSAGTTATLTESMRIDSSGSVGIGTDSPDTTTKCCKICNGERMQLNLQVLCTKADVTSTQQSVVERYDAVHTTAEAI